MVKGPIRTTTITGDYTEPKRATLVIKIPLVWFEQDPTDGLAGMLKNCFCDWSDGRHPFYVELFLEGLYRCVKWSLTKIVEENMFKLYGDEKVQVDANTRVAKWHLESLKIKPKMPLLDIDRAEVEIL